MQGFKIIITVVFMLGFQDLNVMTLLGEDAVDQSMMNTTSQSNETSSKGLSCYISSIAIFSVIYGVENLVVFELYSYIFFCQVFIRNNADNFGIFWENSFPLLDLADTTTLTEGQYTEKSEQAT